MYCESFASCCCMSQCCCVALILGTMCKSIPLPGLVFANPCAHLEEKKMNSTLYHHLWSQALTPYWCPVSDVLLCWHNCQLFPAVESGGCFFPSSSFGSQTKVFNFTRKEKNKLWGNLQMQGQRRICVKNMWQRQRNTQVAWLSTAIILQAQIN